jgi:Dynamin family
MSAPSLVTAVRAVLGHAVDVYAGSAQAATLRAMLDRLDEPLRVAVAGKVKAGKSTLLNALVGEEIAATDVSECTQVVTWYRDRLTPRVTLYPRNGAARQTPLNRGRSALAIDLGGIPPADIERIVVDWPSSHLRTMTLIDTPGIASISTETSLRTQAFLAPADAPAPADAVVYLMRHLHATDARFLESFHDDRVARATPVNAIGVLSRADEIGVGRIDALFSARRIASRYRCDPQVRRLCQTVVPVAGLLAQAGMTLREAEYAALARVASAPRDEAEALVLSADRFVRVQTSFPLPAAERAALLRRFGLFGVRLASTLIRQGAANAPELAVELVRRSGLDDLREVLATQFTQRRDLLKARSALLALDQVLRREPQPGAGGLAAEVERILASAHAFAELRLLNELRTGVVTFDPDGLEEAERLLGGAGASPSARLGLAPEADAAELRRGALDALTRWQHRAESPWSSRAVADAARVVVRTCEGLLAFLPNGSCGQGS